MANKVKGEVSLDFGGETYTVLLDFNALCEFEEQTGKVATKVLESKEAMSASDMRVLMWAGLRQHHPDITLVEAGRILTANVEKLGAAVKASFPDAESSEGNAPPPQVRPPSKRRR